ncbi:MAG: hypothetical protein ACR2G6_01500 [Gemmatimonadaceae bacterium]
MRRIVQLGAPLVALYALACGGGERATDAELSKDLALASVESLELASEQSAGGSQVVSSIELGGAGAHVRAKVPTRRARARAAPSPQPDVEVAEPSPSTLPVPVPTIAEGEAVSVDSRPSPRPQPMPVVYPGGNQAGTDEDGSGDGIGGAIGVVIRGGGVGRDKCELHDRRRPVFVNDRFPTTFPRSGGTFPR